ncbi:hypothetical protein BAU15_08990 [Enterococcus sp. JM4C]|uniref:acyltransferase family protein n=1 Tax=Candidatus Enterococcus huntleyi TaxID=1857217 RepID=UPI001379FD9C|nr:acyltransferase family protein [Enterococcus sp. JM4C]KAF1296771.1 hypothetical protein BAU15_08990 [Enterococcus sp. JM4C]
MNKRNFDIDALKGVGIFLVVLGHIPDLSGEIYKYIYSFHMPLFLFCSGYLLYGKSTVDLKKYSLASFKKIMIPFYMAYTISYIVTIYFSEEKRSLAFFLEFLKGGLLGSHWMQVNNFALWYLPMFLISSIIFRYVCTKGDKMVLFVGIMGFLLSPIVYNLLTNPDEKVLWSANVIFPALFFMMVGYFFNKYTIFNKIMNPKATLPMIVSGGLGLYLAFKYPSEILYVENYWYLICAVLSLLFFIWIVLGNKNKPILYLGKNSMNILSYHLIIIYIFESTHLNQLYINLGVTEIIYGLALTVTIIFISLIPTFIKNKVSREALK